MQKRHNIGINSNLLGGIERDIQKQEFLKGRDCGYK